MIAAAQLLRGKGPVWLAQLVATALLPPLTAEPLILGTTMMVQTIEGKLTRLRRAPRPTSRPSRI